MKTSSSSAHKMMRAADDDDDDDEGDEDNGKVLNKHSTGCEERKVGRATVDNTHTKGPRSHGPDTLSLSLSMSQLNCEKANTGLVFCLRSNN